MMHHNLFVGIRGTVVIVLHLFMWVSLVLQPHDQYAEAAPRPERAASVSRGAFFTGNDYLLQSTNAAFQLDFRAWVDDIIGLEQCMGGVRYTYKNPGALIWSFNDAGPEPWVATNCNLEFSRDGVFSLELNLYEKDGSAGPKSVAWQTPTLGMGAQNLSLLDDGNLVVLDGDGEILWQSFGYFRDLFLIPSGMKFFKNNTLYSRAQVAKYSDFSRPGLFGLRLSQQGRLLLFTNENLFVYYTTGVTTAAEDLNIPDYFIIQHDIDFYGNQSTLLGMLSHNLSMTSSIPNAPNLIGSAFVGNDGNLMVNYLNFSSTRHHYYYNSSISDFCDYPFVCGVYGLCNQTSRSCSCPLGFLPIKQSPASKIATSSSAAVNSSTPAASGCSPADPTFSLSPILVSFSPQQLSAFLVTSEAACRSFCAQNTSCTAALFDANSSTCSLFPVLYTIAQASNKDSTTTSRQVMFLKIPKNSKNSRLATIIISVTIVVATLLTLVLVVGWYRRRCKRDREDSQNDERFLQHLSKLPPRFSYRELQIATNDFSTQLGVGGFGSVYQGILKTPTGMARVAVKRLYQSGMYTQDILDEQFKAEVATIGSVSHVNLVTLRGFCMERNARLLVYEFMENGSLDRWLFTRRGMPLAGSSSTTSTGSTAKGYEMDSNRSTVPVHEQPVGLLDWETRCRIALDTARGLDYLHHQSAEHIVHCDVKPQNILLDENYRAKVADFGLAKLMGNDTHSFAMTSLKGTRGYLAPEWLQHSTITAKSDVYSYGVVLLELITGQRALDNERDYLPQWAMNIITAAHAHLNPAGGVNTDMTLDASLVQLETVVDERLPVSSVSRESFTQMFMLALSCVQADPANRPSMTAIVQTLEGGVVEVAYSPPRLKLTDATFGQLKSSLASPLSGPRRHAGVPYGSYTSTSASNSSVWISQSMNSGIEGR